MDAGLEGRLRRFLIGVCLVVIVAACSGGPLTLSEYATEGGAMSALMEERIVALDAELGSRAVTAPEAREYWDARIRARVELLEDLETLDPPGEIAEMHWDGLDLFSRLISAEEILADRVALFETPTGPDDWWVTDEAAAVGAVNVEIFALCQTFQARYDATIDRTGLSDMPWIPAEMKEIVRIDVGCS